MTVETAIRTCLNLLADVGVGNWNVVVVEDFPENPTHMGLCSYRAHTIYLSAKWLDDDAEMLETMRHEIGHVLSASDRDHGDEFEQALSLVPKQVTREREFRIEQCGPQGEPLPKEKNNGTT